MSFQRIAIVNRGEPAMRLINAVAEYNVEYGTDIHTIALYTDADRHSMFVREADEAFCLGPATFVDPSGHRQVSYLDHERLERALVATEADAVWVGWGFVAEDARFADLCARLGVTFIGPGADVMRRLGDKITSKQIAEAAGVPVAAWSGGPVETVQEAREHAERIGYPILIKATAGGGGRGIRRVETAEDLPEAFDSARSEARGAFGDDTVFVEDLVGCAKHIEVQIIGDSRGTVWPVGVRDCSVQRRNQKIIEEAPSPSLDAEQTETVCAAAVRLAEAAGYRNAGTVEFLYEPESRRFSFMEVNARLQVEHPVSEMTTGLDLVKLQLYVASDGHLIGDLPPTDGYAIEARINAEDPEHGFSPSPGRIELLRLPTGPGLRVDTGVEEGDEIAPEFDSMIAKIIAHGSSRPEAIARLRRALRQTNVVIRNGTTNKAFVHDLLSRPEFVSGDIDVQWVDRVVTENAIVALHAEVAIVAAAIDAYRSERAVEIAAFRAAALRGRPMIEARSGRNIELRYRGRTLQIEVRRLGPGDYRVTVDGHTIEAHREDVARARTTLTIGDRRHRIVSSVHGITHFVDVDGQPHRILHDEGGAVRSPAPAVVVSVNVAEGDRVEAGERLAIIEAMKMETAIVAEFAGTIRQIDVHQNDQVPAGGRLLVLEPAESADEAAPDAPTLSFATLEIDGDVHHDRCAHWLRAIRQLLLGYDVDATESLARPASDPCVDTLGADEQLEREDEVLSIFADVLSLFGREADDEDETLLRHGTEGYLFEYLRRVEARAAGLPQSFVDRLTRTLAHFGVNSLDPSPDLDTALARIVRSHQRMSSQIGPVLQLLERRLEHPTSGGDDVRRKLLEDVARASGFEYPAVRDLAREVVYREFDAPFLATMRWQAIEEAKAHVAALDTEDHTSRAAHIEALVDCPQPLKTMLSRRFAPASPRLRAALLEVMTRRYYRIRPLEDLTTQQVDEFSVASATYVLDERDIHVIATHVERSDLDRCARTLVPLLTAADEGREVVLDIYLWSAEPIADGSALTDEVRDVLDRELGELQLHRIVVAASDASSSSGMSSVRHLTLRPTGDGAYVPEDLSHGLHPMMAKRLELQRLDNFDITSIPAPEDIYLFHGTARDNKRDERLFAIAEVRDLTAVRDESGKLQRLPEVERVVHEVSGAIRRVQAHRRADRRLASNRILLYVWPRLDLVAEDLTGLVARLVPDLVGLGLQKVQVLARVQLPSGRDALRVIELSDPVAGEARVRVRRPAKTLIRSHRPHEQNVVRLRQRGLIDPYELLGILSPRSSFTRRGIPQGKFREYDLVDDELVTVDREPGSNVANIVVGVVSNRTAKYPDGMRRVVLVGDPSRGMGNLAEAECRRIIAGLDLAEQLDIPLEWFAVSAGAKIAMDSGTENMDWIALVLRRIIEFTQAGREINIIVTGISVGAQPYWNAEATMLMHTRGVLIMTHGSSMVLTGKDALDYSGGVSAENNLGIGGYERIMGPNGQAQYLAHDVVDACRILLRHYDYTYVEPGERFPRRSNTTDPTGRDVREHPHGGEFPTIAELFSEDTNPGRKKPFEIRQVMAATVDQDHLPLERWFGMRDAEIPVVWDANLGGWPVCLIGFEAQNLARPGFVPADGPDRWTSSTLFPRGSKKVARAINATSGNRPLVVLASLSGFDGSPESMRTWQLEFGAEIGRAVVNFDGPIVFCVVSRYHGGAFVVFSGALNDHMEVAALEGSHASVIGGAPAAAVVFARDVQTRTDNDHRVAALRAALSTAPGAERSHLASELERVRMQVHADKLGEVAAEFDAIHDVKRAQQVGSIDRIIPPSELRPYLIGAIERGIARDLEQRG